MPAVITHYLHAVEVAKLLRRQEGIKPYLPAMHWGTQGPDFLFFHRAVPLVQMGKSYRKWGSLLHRENPDLLFNAMYNYYQDSRKSKRLLSYIFGFLCHYALDRTAHPYVYYLQKMFMERDHIEYDPHFMHNKIESNLDIIMLQKKNNILPVNFNPASTLKHDHLLLKEIAALMSYVIKTLSGQPVKEKKTKQAFLDMRRNLNLLHDATLTKRLFVLGVEKVLRKGPFLSGMMRDITEDGKYDYANDGHTAWGNTYEPDKEHKIDFFELFDLAVQDACTLIMQFQSAIDLPREQLNITGQIGFLTGVKIEKQK